MTGASAVEVYYDPYDFAIDDDPYPVWKRLRDEAPLYFNEKYNFFALSRYDDVFRELHNWDTYRSGRGTTIDVILSGMDVPPGIILFEDPPIHDLHRRCSGSECRACPEMAEHAHQLARCARRGQRGCAC